MNANQLAGETSPYLLQHKDNPVHWRPWSAAALAEARAENKPILLSIGYAACHWCHVMAHESFEDMETAQAMNSLFIPIKVDREERPDLDAVYQAALSMMGQRGGWPLTMFLTPDGQPFWGGTYFPPKARHGLPGFRDLLAGVHDAWLADDGKITANVASLREALHQSTTAKSGSLDDRTAAQAAKSLLNSVDLHHGGLRGAPKFPHVPLFTLMWRQGLAEGDDSLCQAVLLTLDRMCQGGIYDHLGGGFARYSTDEEWLAPHFEKMLYDNAQMVELLTEVWQTTKQPLWAQRVEETLGWLLREMMAEGQAFAATLDADSEGEEGRYYVWRDYQIEESLPSALLKPFRAAYDVSAWGNWEGKVILNRSHSAPMNERQEELLAVARAKLLSVRQERVPPARDDKILADWNGMMIAAMAKAAFAFGRPDWLATAEQAFAAIVQQLEQDGRLGHSFRHGRRQPQAMIDDYAQMARAALVLYEVSGQNRYLTKATAWADQADQLFWDDQQGGYFFSAVDADDLILRSKTAFDNATPSGNGVMVEVMTRLFLHTGESRYEDQAERIVESFAGEVSSSFPNLATLLNGWSQLRQARHLIIIGNDQDPARQALIDVAAQHGLHSLVLSQIAAGQVVPSHHPGFGKTQTDRATAFLCTRHGCGLPLFDPASLASALAPSSVRA